MAKVSRKVGETRPIEAELSGISRDTFADLDTAASKYLIGRPGQDADIVCAVEVVDSADRTVRAVPPDGVWPDEPGHYSAKWWLHWTGGDIEPVPGTGYDEVRIEKAIGVPG